MPDYLRAMRILIATLALLLFTPNAQASWLYNENGGFGIYQPEGWNGKIEGRSMSLEGPANDFEQSLFFLGSDWNENVETLEQLKAYVTKETGDANPAAITVSELPGFRVGSSQKGSLYILRIPQNFIVVNYELRGSESQVEEGKVMLDSIEIRTRGIEN